MKHDQSKLSFFFFEDHYLKPKGVFFKKALFFSLGFHAVLLLILCSQSLFSSNRENIQPKAILIHSVRLSPKSEQIAMKKPEKKKKAPPVPKENPAPPQPKEKPAPPVSKEAPEKTVEPKVEQKVQQEDPPQAEKPAPVEEKQEVTVEKEVIQKPFPKIGKRGAAKTTQPLSKKKAQKNPTSTPQAKATTPSAPKKKNQAVSKEVAKNVQSLLAQAKMQRKGTADRKSEKQQGTTSPLVGQIADLSFEGEATQEGTGQDYEATPEESYITNLIRLIQISVTLPDKEPVSLKLELFSSGLLKSLTIVSSPSARNRHALEKGLASLRYPAFLRAYKGEKIHSFSFKFTREMEWVSQAR